MPSLELTTGDEAARVDETSFRRFLANLGVAPVLQDPWLMVGCSERTQGWKLHLSTIPTEVWRLLVTVVPLLRDSRVSFKIACDASALMQLNEGQLGPTQIGKFMTIYPEDDEQAGQLARELVAATDSFVGPVVASDFALGGIVYARYGAFNPLVTRDRLGQQILSIHGPDGSPTADLYELPRAPRPECQHPFGELLDDAASTIPEVPARRLFGPGFLLVDVLQTHPRGSVFRAIDLRSQASVRSVVLKEGRRHCCSDEHRRDMCARLKRQLLLHHRLAGEVPIPAADLYFEVKGNGYLVIDYVPGESLEAKTAKPWAQMANGRRRELLFHLSYLAAALRRLHAAGYVHRDLTPRNVLIDEGGALWILDLELAHQIGDPTPPLQLGTPGFLSPAQRRREVPQPADDMFSFGCILVQILTGLHPGSILPVALKDRETRLRGLAGSSPRLIRLACRCLAEEAADRPGVDSVEEELALCLGELGRRAPRGATRITTASPTLDEVVRKGVQGLLSEVCMDPETGLWLSSSLDRPGGLELARSASRGVAGPLYLLARAHAQGLRAPGLQAQVARATDWLLGAPRTADMNLPGLHFGAAGVGVAVAAAAAADLVPRGPRVDAFIGESLRGRLDWPDLTHGAAGQGIAALSCADFLGNPQWTEAAHRSARYLLSTQQADGTWPLPEGVRGMEGEVLYGFAHGLAGIAYFLAVYAGRFADERAEQAWRRAAGCLVARAQPRGRRLEWPWGDRRKTVWSWWCHGSPGIALSFLRFYEQTGEQLFAEVARRALGQPVDPRAANLSQCHGLSGLGDIYLEAWRVLGERRWIERARRIANTLIQLRRERGDSVTWIVEDPAHATADLMVGCAGVLHFLLRLSGSLSRMGPPLLQGPLLREGGREAYL